MKVLKSGIEMTPEELEKTRGSGCACGCDTGVDSSWLYGNFKKGSACGCLCTPPNTTASGDSMTTDAAEYLQ